ncbi:phage protein [Staphylococcus equorum subsp. equorum Mu2]|uniref:DUF3310 domain-containing protein n=1 Tax=Staphylococcus equorum TaxID=246432 RepID=UPI000267DDCE|nr:DUF3310 domain-containing protein [Staphylococcus equorum]CCI60076.1 phage protein [Staphylococcus equorum subsp. equorum Mu2]
MKIRELDLDQYVIVYDIGKSEDTKGMTVVGRVEEIVFHDDGENAATINSLGNLYDITDDNYFDLWSNYIENKTESVSDNKKPSVRWSLIKKNTLVTNEGKHIEIPESMMEDPITDILSYVDKQINKTKQSVEARVKAINKNIEDSQKYIDEVKSNDVQQRKRNDTVNHPSHYNYGDIEVINFIEQVTQHYNPNVAYHIGNAIKYLARSPHKNGKEDVEKAKWYIERAFEKWDVK